MRLIIFKTNPIGRVKIALFGPDLVKIKGKNAQNQ